MEPRDFVPIYFGSSCSSHVLGILKWKSGLNPLSFIKLKFGVFKLKLDFDPIALGKTWVLVFLE